jgi:hypothetical protein
MELFDMLVLADWVKITSDGLKIYTFNDYQIRQDYDSDQWLTSKDDMCLEPCDTLTEAFEYLAEHERFN